MSRSAAAVMALSGLGLGRRCGRRRHGELRFPGQPLAEGFTLDERHHVEDGAGDRPRVEEGENLGVLEVGRGLDLRQEPLGADHGGQLRPEDLESDLTVVAAIVREVDRRHPALTERALDPIPIGEGRS
jgi:hypothetical protein